MLRQLRDAMAGYGTAQERLDRIVQLIARGILPAAALATVALGLRWLLAKPTSRLAYQPHLFTFGLAAGTCLLYCVMLRLCVLFIPHLALLASLLLDDELLLPISPRKLGRLSMPMRVLLLTARTEISLVFPESVSVVRSSPVSGSDRGV